jgi:hypothetical protein
MSKLTICLLLFSLVLSCCVLSDQVIVRNAPAPDNPATLSADRIVLEGGTGFVGLGVYNSLNDSAVAWIEISGCEFEDKDYLDYLFISLSPERVIDAGDIIGFGLSVQARDADVLPDYVECEAVYKLNSSSSHQTYTNRFLVIKNRESYVPEDVLNKYPNLAPAGYGDSTEFTFRLPPVLTIVCLIYFAIGSFLIIKGVRMIRSSQRGGWFPLVIGIVLVLIGISLVAVYNFFDLFSLRAGVK